MKRTPRSWTDIFEILLPKGKLRKTLVYVYGKLDIEIDKSEETSTAINMEDINLIRRNICIARHNLQPQLLENGIEVNVIQWTLWRYTYVDYKLYTRYVHDF